MARQYATDVWAICETCSDAAPVSYDKSGAAEEARRAGWYVGTYFLCPECRNKSKPKPSRKIATKVDKAT